MRDQVNAALLKLKVPRLEIFLNLHEPQRNYQKNYAGIQRNYYVEKELLKIVPMSNLDHGYERGFPWNVVQIHIQKS